MKRTLVFMAICTLFVVSGLPAGGYAEPGVEKKEIRVGMSTVLIGPAAFLGTSFRQGAETYLNWVNANGGVYGRKIRLIVYDDGYEPSRTVVNVKRLITEEKVFCLLGDVGTPTTVAIKPILEAERVPLFAPFTGAESIRDPVSRYLFHYRASYNQELDVFIHGVVDVLKYRRVAVFFQDDAYGLAVLSATKLALGKRGLDPIGIGTYVRNFNDVSQAVKSLMMAKPDVVVMAGTYSACAKFITSWKRQTITGSQNVPPPVFMNVSFVGPDMLANMLSSYGEKVVVTQVVPPFAGASKNYPAVDEYQQLAFKYFHDQKPNIVGLEGFLATKVFVEVLRRAGKDLTREGFIQAAENIRDFDIQAGNVISYYPGNHQGSQMVYPTVIRNAKFQLIRDWNEIR